jgi:RNA polymerase sigma-70 factor (ECF subfamily)
MVHQAAPKDDGHQYLTNAGPVQRATPLDFAEIVRVHGRALEGRALWLTKSDSDAADLYQETIEHALRGTRRALSPEVVRRWLFAIMYNLFLDHWRAQSVRRSVVFDSRLEDQLAWEPQSLVPMWRTVDDETIQACIARLPDYLKEVIQLQLSGASYTQLAQQLGLPASTIGTRLLRARRRLRSLLDAEIGPRRKASYRGE